MTRAERKTLCGILFELFMECVDEETDTAKIIMEIPGVTKKIIAHIIFDITDMEENENDVSV